jgi:hypothetical protein
VEVPVGLTNVWVQTQGDGLVRADQVVGIDAHQTPALSGKPPRWLLDVVLPSSIGSGTREGWDGAMVHRTLVQSTEDPADAPAALARLLAQLDLVSAAGVITASREDTRDGKPGKGRTDAPRAGAGDDLVAGSGRVRFRFVPFASPAPGHHTGAEYL